MNESELWMSLRVATDKAEQDVQKWSAKTFQGGGKSGLASSPAQTINEMLGKQFEGLRRKKSITSFVNPLSDGPTRQMMAAWMKQSEVKKQMMGLDRSKFMKDATFAMMPLFNPTSVWGNLFASRQIFSAFSGTKTGGNIMRKMGLSGTGGAVVAAGGTVSALLVVGLAIKALTKTMHEVMKAYQSEGTNYAKALTSGLGIGFVTKRSMLADIMGVSEVDVVKFGAAMTYLNPKIEWASGILAKTNANLTSVGWNFKVLQNDMGAAFATIANDAAPALRQFIDGLYIIVKKSTEFYNFMSRALPHFDAPPWLVKFLVGPIMGMGKDTGPAPMAQSWMKQMPGSSWEHMGLVIGGGGGNNPAQITARNTSRLVQLNEQIYRMAIDQQRGISVFGSAQSYQ
jgi:hypothetical protein